MGEKGLFFYQKRGKFALFHFNVNVCILSDTMNDGNILIFLTLLGSLKLFEVNQKQIKARTLCS
jgi:hypothetical protein